MEIKTWKEVFKANYEGTSEEAKELKPFLKENYKGNVYIPWAVMERLTYMCDETANFYVIYNEDGGVVHTDTTVNRNYSKTNDKEVETEGTMYSHFVRVGLLFMGKSFIEDYPIQDKDYTSLKIYDQNSVNKSLQRAKAKVAARGTGLALKLYEGNDLQFEEDVKEVKPKIDKVVDSSNNTTEEKPVKKTTAPKKVVKEEIKEEVKEANIEKTLEKIEEIEKKEEVKENVEKVEYSSNVIDLVNYIKSADENSMTKVLQDVNISVIKKYGFALSTVDDFDTLCEKCSKLKDAAMFKNTLQKLMGE